MLSKTRPVRSRARHPDESLTKERCRIDDALRHFQFLLVYPWVLLGIQKKEKLNPMSIKGATA